MPSLDHLSVVLGVWVQGDETVAGLWLERGEEEALAVGEGDAHQGLVQASIARERIDARGEAVRSAATRAGGAPALAFPARRVAAAVADLVPALDDLRGSSVGLA